MSDKSNSSVSNIYQLEGRVPVSRAIPFGLQHILAMFVANISPIIIVAGASGVSGKQLAMLIQSAMLIAGIGTLIQLFPLWKIGSGLPIVMGISFTFVSIMCYIGANYGYGTIMGAVLIGGLIEGCLGLLQILDEDHLSYRIRQRRNSHWLFSSVGRLHLLWRWQRQRKLWLRRELDPWYYHTVMLYFI